MRAYDIIQKKRDGGELLPQEIRFFVNGYVQGHIPESQAAAWLMAVFFRGMSAAETLELTLAMVSSGATLDLSCIPGIKVDKHSTGGVGDKTTLVLVPLLAAAGVPVAKMSGRSLGYTGGTLDKLESIPGFNCALGMDEIVEQVKRVGAVMAGQTEELVPADKKLYALRDITATVDCIALIAASVMSKKIASGTDAVLLDVKFGSGAFMHRFSDALKLAEIMVEIGRMSGKRVEALVTTMDQPLGHAVGNALEVAESINTLLGEGPDDLAGLCTQLGAAALVLGERASSYKEGEKMIGRLIKSGEGAQKFREIIRAQGGDPNVIDDLSLLPAAPLVQKVNSPASGYVERLDALAVAQASFALGAGRGDAKAQPDPAVGVYLHKKIGDKVARGDVLAELHARSSLGVEGAADLISGAYTIGPVAPAPIPIVQKRVR
ncbi:MAG: thymidine phosphorylase [Armatimonadota bacterium]